MWPEDALWDLVVQIVILVALVVARERARRASGRPTALRLPDLTLEPRAKGVVAVLALATLFTFAGWLAQTAQLGVAQTVAMALGGPNAGEIYTCRRNLGRRHADGFPPECLQGGTVTRHPSGHWVCDKHGDAIPPPAPSR